jgi:hypothetical protein
MRAKRPFGWWSGFLHDPFEMFLTVYSLRLIRFAISLLVNRVRDK